MRPISCCGMVSDWLQIAATMARTYRTDGLDDSESSVAPAFELLEALVSRRQFAQTAGPPMNTGDAAARTA